MKFLEKDLCKESRDAWDGITNINYLIHERYGLAYISNEEYNTQVGNLMTLKHNKDISVDEFYITFRVLDTGVKERIWLKNFLYEINEPRKQAQKFIGKKNIRKLIFERDGNSCLNCGSGSKLSLDHIVPINKGGLNRLYNLQTLCMPCNSSKGTKIIDYR
jgi:hypothetical protein